MSFNEDTDQPFEQAQDQQFYSLNLQHNQYQSQEASFPDDQSNLSNCKMVKMEVVELLQSHYEKERAEMESMYQDRLT